MSRRKCRRFTDEYGSGKCNQLTYPARSESLNYYKYILEDIQTKYGKWHFIMYQLDHFLIVIDKYIVDEINRLITIARKDDFSPSCIQNVLSGPFGMYCIFFFW